MGHYHDLKRELYTSGRELRALIPDVYEGFSKMQRSSVEDGALPGRVKELIALAISVVEECDGCIGAHAQGAARSGATRQEVAEALGVAILMAGGPATVYGPRAWEAFREFSDSSDSSE